MPNIKVSGMSINTEDMNDEERCLLEALRHIDRKIALIKDEIAVYQTAIFFLNGECDNECRAETTGGTSF